MLRKELYKVLHKGCIQRCNKVWIEARASGCAEDRANSALRTGYDKEMAWAASLKPIVSPFSDHQRNF